MQHNVDKILELLLSDEKFREEFERDRFSVLKRFSLTAVHVAALAALSVPILLATITAVSGGSEGKPI